MTLAQLRDMGDFAPGVSLMASRELVGTYEEFVKVLYQDIDQCVAFLEEDPGIRSDDSEDRLTAELIGMLRSRGYDAAHDEKVGGHSDIVVRHPRNWLWLGEAKIHSSYDYLWQGFNQLCTRYSRGTPDANQGGLIVYVRGANTANVVATWRQHLAGKNLPQFSEAECTTRRQLGFFTTHEHEGSGLPITVRHVAVVQYFQPLDRRVKKDADQGS